MLRKNNELTSKPLPNINRKMITVMKEYFKIIDSDNKKNEKKEEIEDKSTAFERLAHKMESEIMHAPEIGIDFNDCYKNLDR